MSKTLKILYWNIKKKGAELINEIDSLSQDIDILIIAELSISNNRLLTNGSSIKKIIDSISKKIGFVYKGHKASSWLHVWVRDSSSFKIELIDIFDKQWQPRDLVDKECGNSEYLTEYLNRFERMLFYRVKYYELEFLLIPIHFPSRMFASVGKQKDISVHFKNYIENVEKRTNLNSIVVGDFNMNPFEPGMIHHEGFHAVPAGTLDDKIEFYNIPYRTFYNPSWVKFGDFEILNNKLRQKPGGSYYYENSSDINYYWYVLDQVIIRKNLIQNFCFEDYEHITSIKKNKDLLNADYSPNDIKYSDHLPLKFQLKI